MDLQELRTQIDKIDDQLVHLFVQRMAVSAQVAAYKKEHGLPVLMPAREQDKLRSLGEIAGPEMAEYVQNLYLTIFELSRNYQSRLNNEVK